MTAQILSAPILYFQYVIPSERVEIEPITFNWSVEEMYG